MAVARGNIRGETCRGDECPVPICVDPCLVLMLSMTIRAAARASAIRTPVMSDGHSSTGISDALALSRVVSCLPYPVIGQADPVPAATHPVSQVRAVIETATTARAVAAASTNEAV